MKCPYELRKWVESRSKYKHCDPERNCFHLVSQKDIDKSKLRNKPKVPLSLATTIKQSIKSLLKGK